MKMTFDIKTNSMILPLGLDITKLQKRKQHAIKKMIEKQELETLTKYIRTLKGTYSRMHSGDLFKHDQYTIPYKSKVQEMVTGMKKTSSSHVPMFAKTSRDWIGIEIECFAGSSSFNSLAEDYNLDNELDGRDILRNVIEAEGLLNICVKYDGSIVPDHSSATGVEIVVLTRFSNTKNLKAICELLNKYNFKVNKSCGLHVHFNMLSFRPEGCRNKSIHSNTDFKKIIHNLTKSLPCLSTLVPESRRDNTFCKLKYSDTDRYSALNGCAVDKYGTLEVRLHSSTTDYNKIMNWATLLRHIMDSPKFKGLALTINELDSKSVFMPEALLEYFSQREALFSNTPSTTDTTAISAQDTDNSSAA